MGFRYILYRVYHMFLVKSKLIKIKFPAKYRAGNYITLSDWRSHAKPFFFSDRSTIGDFPILLEDKQRLQDDYNKLRAGHIQYFNHEWIKVGFPINWHLNPDSGYEYPENTHWAYIPDLSSKNGDIKYVWEKSRFSFLYTIIRYDQHFKEDSSAFVYNLIEDWIDKNPINLGPNYKCSQEISLRLMNWVFALYYYKNSETLNELLFAKILNSIRQQIKHVYSNIHFSRITVRNNHAITESLCLYLIGMLFPSFPESKLYNRKGKKYFEKEIAYQIYEDGTYLQFSMNYHRVVVQLLAWALKLSENNNIKLSEVTHQRAKATFSFLYYNQDDVTGKLPNYGANDGALFFKLNSEAFLNHSPQLNSLYSVLYGKNAYTNPSVMEDAWWYSGGELDLKSYIVLDKPNLYAADIGGFYTMRCAEYFSMVRCGNHKDRPQQADQNHIDIWYQGKNIIRDNGSYKYNTDAELVQYFSGTASHNTVQLAHYNQMLKGGRFIWYFWSNAKAVSLKPTSSYSVLDASANVYSYLDPEIVHRRVVKQYYDEPKWEIEDTMVLGGFKSDEPFKQIWHISDDFFALGFDIKSYNREGVEIEYTSIDVWNSEVYGEKRPSKALVFERSEPYFITVILKSKGDF